MRKPVPTVSSVISLLLAAVGTLYLLGLAVLLVFGWGTRGDRASGMGGAALCFAGAALVRYLGNTLRGPAKEEFLRYLLRILSLAARHGHSFGYSLLAMAEDFGGARKNVLFAMLSVLDEGKPLSEALAAAGPQWIPVHVVEAVRGAERSGRMADALEAALEDCAMPKAGRASGRATLAMLYVPILGGVFLFLATFIIPQFATIFGQIVDKTGRPLELPAATQIVLRVSDAMGSVLPVLFLLVVLLYLPLRSAWFLGRFRGLLDPLVLRLPVVGPCVLFRASQRLCRSLAVEVRAGVPLGTALSRAGESCGNEAVRRSAEAAAADALAGMPADSVLASLRISAFARARAAAAGAAGSERLAPSLESLAQECRWKYLQARDLAIESVYPVVFVGATLMVLLVYLGVFGAIIRLQGALM